MNRKILLIVLVLATTLLMMTFAAMPVNASLPKKGTFEQGIVQVTTTSGTSWTTGDILHVKGGTATSFLFGALWGNTLSGSAKTKYFELNTVTLNGWSVGTTMDTFGAGVEVGTIFNKLNGPGPYVYMGPTFSFTLPGISETVTHGDTYIGLLFSGHGVKHGISGDLKGVETKETYTGVAIQVGPLAGVALVDNTVDYKLSCYDMIPASMDSTSISYDALTAMCLGAGLSGNPYPAPTTPVLYPPDANNIGHLIGESDYYTFTVKIGCKVYEGISCNVVDYALNFNTMELDGVSKATWYIGKLGCLHSGFKGIVYEYIYNYDPIANSWDYLTVSFMMTHGFGHFCGQRLWMYWDSRGSATTYGYCFVREH